MNGEGMVPVDIITGLPEEWEERAKREREKRDMAAKNELRGLVNSLEGKEVVAIVEGILLEKVEKLLREDAKCRVLMEVLSVISHMDSVEKAAPKMTGKVMGRMGVSKK
jgi:hypothetical protein